MTDVLFFVCWQEQGEAWGWEPLSAWFEQEEAEVEMGRLVEVGADFKLAVQSLCIGVPARVIIQPEAAWVGPAIFPDEPAC